jgi:type IV pilus assembly protein PilN|tara:strand:- start:3223 stop:5310 length:2088 start_codon:yes stop_codon:yes gene_type:complete
METIHRKNNKLHIYVRQDKYKGELKSNNWVGRTYINGKQKVSSSGTTNLEEAIPILEKWFDVLQTEKEVKKTENVPQEKVLTQNIENKSQNTEETITQDTQSDNENSIKSKTKGVTLDMLGKLKNFRLSKSKETTEEPPSNPSEKLKKNKLKNIFGNFFKSKVSKLSIAGEEIAGIDMTREAIRVAQVSKNKEEKWILDKFSYRILDQDKISENLLEHKDYLSEEIELAMANGKITTKNVAISIPVTSAIIRVVTSPLMIDDELQKAIETDSLWENLIQLTDNLNDYSIFHQVINRNTKNNTMDILFVASKLSDVNAYSSIAKKSGLNPVIMDVRCFTLKNAYDNTRFKSITDKANSAILELGVDENYLMIIHNNIPIITDVFLRPQEKQHLLDIESAQVSNEIESVIRRYSMQIKQAITDYESKYENKITSIQVVSSLKNIKHLIPLFKKNLPTTGFVNFDPLEGVEIPSYNSEKINIENKSPLASVLGLAYRKLDVFGYYKFVTAVKNINLLPNRDAIRQQNKLKFLSGFALKGVAAAVAGIYLIMIVFSFFQINSNKQKLLEFDQVQTEFNKLNEDFSKLAKKRREMVKSLELGKMVNSNQSRSYRSLAQVTRSVPQRVQFTKMIFDGNDSLIIEGIAFSDQDILNFISNLNAKSLIEQASLAAMQNQSGDQGNSGSNNKKGFTINCKLKLI